MAISVSRLPVSWELLSLFYRGGEKLREVGVSGGKGVWRKERQVRPESLSPAQQNVAWGAHALGSTPPMWHGAQGYQGLRTECLFFFLVEEKRKLVSIHALNPRPAICSQT